MALYDNKYWLMSHIRNSFISTDDTGMCELIMAGEEGVRKRLKDTLDAYPDEDDSEDEDTLSHESYDLQPDWDFGIRYRSNTAARLEKLEQVKRKSAKMKHIKWEMSKTPLSQEALEQMFQKKEVKPPDAGKKSLFSETFKQYTKLPTNPFIKYSKFDGSGQVNMPTKKYKIFLTMLPEHQRNYPMHVVCIGSAKIQELIGLILLKCRCARCSHLSTVCSNLDPTSYEEHHWKSAQNYGLYITEEDGEVDRDFPCLDPVENIAKFGFTCLGLVEHTDMRSVSFEHSETIAMGKSFEDIINKRSREQAKNDQEKQILSDLQLMDVHNRAMEAPLYKSYLVYMVNKMRSKSEIHLGISGEKVEIDPVQQNSKFALVKHKPTSHHIDSIAWCEVTDARSTRFTFKLVYSPSPENRETYSPTLQPSHSFKTYEFEADPATAEEIVQKIGLILELRSSETRKEYVTMQERKHTKKKFNLK